MSWKWHSVSGDCYGRFYLMESRLIHAPLIHKQSALEIPAELLYQWFVFLFGKLHLPHRKTQSWYITMDRRGGHISVKPSTADMCKNYHVTAEASQSQTRDRCCFRNINHWPDSGHSTGQQLVTLGANWKKMVIDSILISSIHVGNFSACHTFRTILA